MAGPPVEESLEELKKKLEKWKFLGLSKSPAGRAFALVEAYTGLIPVTPEDSLSTEHP